MIVKVNNLQTELCILLHKNGSYESFLYDALLELVEVSASDFGIVTTLEPAARMKIHHLRFSKNYEADKSALKNLSGQLIESSLSPINTADMTIKHISPENYDSPYKSVIESNSSFSRVSLVPLVLPDGTLRGLIELFNLKNDAKHDINKLLEAGIQIAIYIDNYKKTSMLTDRAQALRELSLINKAIQAPQEIHEVVETILKYTSTFFESDGCSILLEDQNDNIAFVVATGENAGDLKNVSLNKNEGIVGWVMTNQEPLLVENVDKDKRFSGRIDKITDFETGSIMCVPLKVFNETVGVLEVIRQKGAMPYNKNELELLNILSTYVSLALYKEKFLIQRDEWFKSTLRFLDEMISVKDHLYPGSTKILKKYITLFGLQLDMEPAQLNELNLAAAVKDIGKLVIPEKILEKEGVLTVEEWEQITGQPIVSVDILSNINEFRDIIPIIKHYHEAFDGSGYPSKLKGKKIPYLARVFAILDAYTAMISDRPYRRALSKEEAKKIITEQKGKKYDSELVDQFLQILN